MHDHGIGLAIRGVHALVEPKTTPIHISLFAARKPLLLNARAVNDIDIGDARLERVGLEHLMARLTKTVNDLCGHTECLGRDQAHLQAVKQ